MVSHKNVFVDYLNRFTTVSPEHEAAFDEFVEEVTPPGDRLRLDTKTEAFLRDLFANTSPPSVILTGNAGDGKTYLCRKIIETFAGEFDRWPSDEIEWTITRPDGRQLHVVKDLSETDESKGLEVLRRLEKRLSDDNSNDVFLIAANEGRLRAIMSRGDDLPRLREEVERQLQRDVPDTENTHLILLNLNKTTASTHVPDVLTWIATDEHWEVCAGCPAFENCPIRHNADNVAKPHIQARIRRLYQVLEHLGYHLTIRDTLMHLSYVVTGGLRCAEVISPDDQDAWNEQAASYAYHENIWGEMATDRLRRKILAIYHLRRLNPGRISTFEIDQQIIDEDPSEEYKAIFSNTTDLGWKFYQQAKDSYRRGTYEGSNSGNGEPAIITRWLPYYRRKIFVELIDEREAMKLLPFIYIADYFELLEGAKNKQVREIRTRLVIGLNRAFSNLFLNQSDYLYVTAQYAHSAEHPIPIVKMKVHSDAVELKTDVDETHAMDREYQKLVLEIYPPARLYGSEAEVWSVNLIIFEYLLRRGDGGTANILADECGLTIRRLKDRLLTRASKAEHKNDEPSIEFFAVQNNQYQLQDIIIDEDD